MHRRPERCNTPSSAKSTTRKRSSPAKVLLGFHESYGYKVPDASGSEATHRGVAKNERKGLRREAGKASSAATARRHRRYPVPERSFRVWLPKFSRSKISGFCENTSARQVFFIFGWTLNASFRSFAKNSLLHSVFSDICPFGEYEHGYMVLLVDSKNNIYGVMDDYVERFGNDYFKMLNQLYNR